MNLVAGCLWDNPASAAAGAMQKGSCLRSSAVTMRPAPRRAAGEFRVRRVEPDSEGRNVNLNVQVELAAAPA